MEEMTKKECVTCKCPHHSFLSWLVVLFGAVFLVQALGWLDQNTVSVVWPVIVIAAGLMKMSGKKCKCC